MGGSSSMELPKSQCQRQLSHTSAVRCQTKSGTPSERPIEQRLSVLVTGQRLSILLTPPAEPDSVRNTVPVPPVTLTLRESSDSSGSIWSEGSDKLSFWSGRSTERFVKGSD